MTDDQQPTVRELRETAAELNIDGRSNMDRDELETAIAQARDAAGDTGMVATATTTPPPAAVEADVEETDNGRPPLREVAEDRARKREETRRVMGVGDDPQED